MHLEGFLTPCDAHDYTSIQNWNVHALDYQRTGLDVEHAIIITYGYEPWSDKLQAIWNIKITMCDPQHL